MTDAPGGLARGSLLALLVGAMPSQDPNRTDTLLADLADVAARRAAGDGAWAVIERVLADLAAAPPAARKALAELISSSRTAPCTAADLPHARAVWRRLTTLPGLAATDRVYALLNWGDLEYGSGDEDEALRLWEATLQGATKWPAMRFHVHMRMFYACLDRRNVSRATEALAAARTCMPPGDADQLRFWTMEAHHHLRAGRFAAAHVALARARTLREAPGVAVEDQETLRIAEIDVALESGDYRDGLQLCEELLATASSVETRQRVRMSLAVANGRLGDPTRRATAITALAALREEALPRNRPFVTLELTELLLLAGDTGRAAAMARELVAGRPLLELPAPQRITAIAGEVGANADAMDPARRSLCLQVLEQTWLEVREQWHAMPIDGAGVAFLQQKFRRNLLSLWFRIDAAADGGGAAARCLARYLEADASGSAARRAGHAPPTLPQVQALVPDDGVMLVYLPAEAGSFVFVVTRQAVEMLPLPSSTTLEAIAGDIRRAIGDTSDLSATLQEHLRSSAALLLPQALAERIASCRSLCIVGRELCGGIPFTALPWPRQDVPWLGLAKAISYLPSLTVAVQIATNAPPVSGSSVRLLAATDLSTADRERWHTTPLRLTSGRLHDAVADVAPEQVTALPRAQRNDLLRQQPPAALAAVIAHGIQDGARPRHNGMLLLADADGATGAVWPEDIEAAGAPGRIVVLGVCGAAASTLRRGEDGSHHLGGAMLQAGAAGVVLSDQQVLLDDVLTVLQCVTAAMARGEEPAEGLRLARVALWQQRGAIADLAAFRYEGLPAPAVRLVPAPPGSDSWFGFGVGGLAVLGASVWWFRRRRRTAEPGSSRG